MAYLPCPHPGCDLAPRSKDFDAHMREHKAPAPQGERPRELPANPQGVHIRMAKIARPDGSDWWPTDTEARRRLEAHISVQNARTYCGQSGGSISLDHYQQNPSDHVSILPLCPECERLTSA